MRKMSLFQVLKSVVFNVCVSRFINIISGAAGRLSSDTSRKPRKGTIMFISRMLLVEYVGTNMLIFT